jgi:predicted RNase H-like HicB family nuclease
MNHYPLEVFWSHEDGGFIAEAPDLPGCSAFGQDEEEAVKEAQDAIASWLAAAKAMGRAIPAPSQIEPLDAYSGKLVVRFGRTLHAQLARRAQIDGLSLNQFVVRLVSANLAADLVARIPAGVRLRAMDQVAERAKAAAAGLVERPTPRRKSGSLAPRRKVAKEAVAARKRAVQTKAR